MIRFLGIYLLGLFISVFFLGDILAYFNTGVMNISLISNRPNDLYQLGLRILISYFFGMVYFIFKVKLLKIDLSIGQIILSTAGLILLFIIIDFLQVLVRLFLFKSQTINIYSILPLWLTFPCILIYYGIILKYGYKRKDIKWFF